MASEVIKLNIIPTGEMPVFHCSQFDNGRLINIELYRGEDAYTIPEGCTAELHCRKVDGNIVTIGSPVVDENTIKFTSTTQLTACNGKNLCEVAILGADDYLIGSLNFWLEVEIDPLKGGINSTSEIHDLYEQIEDITEEVIGDNYYDKSEVDYLLTGKADVTSVYTKTETDAKLALKANASSVYTKSETDTLLLTKADASDVYTKAQIETKLAAKADAADVYTKTETDTLLDAKANANGVYSKVEVDAMVDDLEDAIDLKADQSTTYTKTEVDTALALKANAADVYTKTQTDTSLALKADKSDTYTKTQVDALIASIFPTKTATGAIASFTTALALPLVSCTVAEGATTVIRCGVNLWDEQWELGLYDTTTGEKTPDNYYIRCKNFIPVKAGTTIYISAPQNIRPLLYDNEQNFINAPTSFHNSTFTIPTGVFYMTFYVSAVYGTTYNYDISLNYPSTDTTYHAYNGQTVPVADVITLTTQSGVNNVFADSGDVTVQYKDTTL